MNQEKENQKELEKVKDKDVVNPWEVSGKVKYDKLVEEFGTQLINDELIKRFEQVTKREAHPWLKRGLFFCHRDLNKILDAYEKGEQIFLYTGRGPTSDALHVGHLIPFMFTQWLQEVFDCYLVIQLSDDEKFYFKNNSFKEIYKLGRENAKDIIAVGFNPQKTFIFSNRDYRLSTPPFEELTSEINKTINFKQLTKIFGFDEHANTGMILWPSYQIAAGFSEAYPHLFRKKTLCLIPYAIDQDPYFRLSRDVAKKLKLLSPCSIIGKFIPPLTGTDGKMSSSVSKQSTIFLTDDEKTIKSKIKKFAFSGAGGDGSLEDHKKFGGNIERIYKGFSKGDITCGETKDILGEKLCELILKHQKRRSEITDDEVDLFYAKDKIMYKNIISPYEKEIPCFSYPGMTLINSTGFMDVIIKNVRKQFNAIGTHTRSVEGEGGFDDIQMAEREYIFWIAKHLYKTSKDIEKDIDGYLCSGATEANIMGLWVLRNMFIKKGCNLDNIHTVYSKLTHYSIIKACDILNIKNQHSVQIDNKLRVDYDELIEIFDSLVKDENNRIILILNVGTTLGGSIDKISKINKIISEKYKDKIYIHLDAAFGGFILPFTESKKEYFFENENVLTICLDAHKTGQLPYPSGIFLCRKDMQKYIEIHVDYIYGSHDDTLIGSRNGLIGLLGKWYVHHFGEKGQKDFVNYCLDGKKRLIEEIKKELDNYIELKHSPKYMNYVSFSFKNLDEKQILQCEDVLMLRFYYVEGKKVYKIPIMPHTVKSIKKFISTIKKVLK